MKQKLELEEIANLLAVNRELAVGRNFTHKSGVTYVVTGFTFNVESQEIDVLYSPVGAPDVTFNRDWEQFCDGRFGEVR